MECTASESGDEARLAGPVNMLEDMAAIQRGPDQHTEWANRSLMMFSQDKCKALQLTWTKPLHWYG